MTTYRPPRYRFTWQEVVFFAALLLLAALCHGCRDQDPPPPGIEGAWKQTAPESPGWVYYFDNGIVTQQAKGFGASLSFLQFTYAERGDTLYIGGDMVNPPRTWVLYFLGDNDLKVREQPADTSGREAWPVLYFERL